MENRVLVHSDRKRRFVGALAITALLAGAACATLAPPDINQAKDFTTTGFLDESTLQVIITAEADKSARGLVARRDSARNNAEKRFDELVTGGIADLRISLCMKDVKTSSTTAQQAPALKKSIMDASRQFLQQGKRVAEYYRDDESMVIVYRISRSGIKGDFNSIRCETGKTEPVEEKKTGGSR